MAPKTKRSKAPSSTTVKDSDINDRDQEGFDQTGRRTWQTSMNDSDTGARYPGFSFTVVKDWTGTLTDRVSGRTDVTEMTEMTDLDDDDEDDLGFSVSTNFKAPPNLDGEMKKYHEPSAAKSKSPSQFSSFASSRPPTAPGRSGDAALSGRTARAPSGASRKGSSRVVKRPSNAGSRMKNNVFSTGDTASRIQVNSDASSFANASEITGSRSVASSMAESSMVSGSSLAVPSMMSSKPSAATQASSRVGGGGSSYMSSKPSRSQMSAAPSTAPSASSSSMSSNAASSVSNKSNKSSIRTMLKPSASVASSKASSSAMSKQKSGNSYRSKVSVRSARSRNGKTNNAMSYATDMQPIHEVSSAKELNGGNSQSAFSSAQSGSTAASRSPNQQQQQQPRQQAIPAQLGVGYAPQGGGNRRSRLGALTNKFHVHRWDKSNSGKWRAQARSERASKKAQKMGGNRAPSRSNVMNESHGSSPVGGSSASFNKRGSGMAPDTAVAKPRRGMSQLYKGNIFTGGKRAIPSARKPREQTLREAKQDQWHQTMKGRWVRAMAQSLGMGRGKQSSRLQRNMDIL